MRHKTKDKGDLAVAHVIADLRQHNIIPCLPISEHLPFDMIAVMPDMATLIRLQVKYRESKTNGAIVIEFRSNYYDSQRIYSKAVNFDELDAYAGFIGNTGQVSYFRIEELPENASTITLRFQLPKNNQRKGVNLVDDFTNPLQIAAAWGTPTGFEMRTVSPFDEIAIAHATAWLQQQGIHPHYPTSQYAPFDLVGVESDMKTIIRYRIGYDTVQYTPYADKFIIYDSASKELRFVDDVDAIEHARISEIAS
jgi:hypothetical protein